MVPPAQAADDTGAGEATIAEPASGAAASHPVPPSANEVADRDAELTTDLRTPSEHDAETVDLSAATLPKLGSSAEAAGDPHRGMRADSVVTDSEPTEVFEGSPSKAPAFEDAPTLLHNQDEAATRIVEQRGDPDDPLAERELESDPEWEPEAPSPRPQPRRRPRPQPTTYFAVGFWRRAVAATIDLAIVLPVSLLMGWLAGAVSGIHLPPSRHYGVDFWLDLLLASNPAFVGWLGLTVVVGCLYLAVFQGTIGRTLGMKLMKTRIIDAYGDSPSMARAAVRTAGYLVSVATLGLGFIWIGFDSDKRGLHDWIAGTYVIKD